MKPSTLRRGRTFLLAAVALLVMLAGSAAVARALTGQPVETRTHGVQLVTKYLTVEKISRAAGVAPCPVGTTAIDGGVSTDSEPFTRVVTSAADVHSSGWGVELWNQHPSRALVALIWAECLALG